jgi:formylglycine-generating enzyme required for sulfatase activity
MANPTEPTSDYIPLYQPNQTLGLYRLVRFLGHGAFGEVWESKKTNNLLEESFALKIALPHIRVDHTMLRNEASLWQKVAEHPNIVRFISAEIVADPNAPQGIPREVIILVSELCDGGTLEAHLKKHGPLSVEESLKWMGEILAGVARLHEAKIIHRDLKPTNILIHEGHAKIADLGLARLIDTGNSGSSKGIGTPLYMAPESFDGHRNERTDIWSLGVILFEMLTGATPFVSPSTSEVLMAIVSKPIPRMSSSIPSSIQAIVRKTLEKQPSNRFQTVGEFSEALKGSLKEQAQSEVKSLTDEQGKREETMRSAEAKAGRKAQEQRMISRPNPEIWIKSEAKIKNEELSRRGLLVGGLLTGAGALGFGGWYMFEKEKTNNPSIQRNIKSKINPKDGADMVWIPEGSFLMGSNTGENDEKPVHRVTLSGFWMYKTPVTVRMYQKFCKDTVRKMPEAPSEFVWKGDWGLVLDHPVVKVNYSDCIAYGKWAGGYLPTEAQFEYATRGGKEGLAYPWGDTIDDSKCWYVKTSAEKGTASVRRNNNVYENGYGLIDMSGNVWQWCRDSYTHDWYKQLAATKDNPENTSDSMGHVLRGGSWDILYPNFLQCANRIMRSSSDHDGDFNLGFRLVIISPPQ